MKLKGIGIDTNIFAQVKEGENLIRENIKRILLTSPGERPNNLNFGVGLKNYLFSPINQKVIQDLYNNIQNQLSTYLPAGIDFIIDISEERNELENSIKNLIINIKYKIPISLFESKEGNISFTLSY